MASPCATLNLSLRNFCGFFCLPAIELVSGRGQIPQSRYSSRRCSQCMHSTQYLWITSYYQKKEARDGW